MTIPSLLSHLSQGKEKRENERDASDIADREPEMMG